MSQEKFFVRINNSEEIRKSVLALSKDIILAMKRFHNLKQIRQEKNNLTLHVSKLFKEIEELCQLMDFSAPDFGIGNKNNEKKQNQEENEKKQPEPKEESEIKEKNTDRTQKNEDYDEQMKRIEQSAAEIEKKLRELV